MYIESFFSKNEQFNTFFEELEKRAEDLDLKTSESAKWTIAQRKGNRWLNAKDLTHIRMFPALVKEFDGNNEASLIAMMETEDGPRFLGYMSLGYEGFDNEEATKWTEIISEDKVVFDPETRSFVLDPYQA